MGVIAVVVHPVVAADPALEHIEDRPVLGLVKDHIDHREIARIGRDQNIAFPTQHRVSRDRGDPDIARNDNDCGMRPLRVHQRFDEDTAFQRALREQDVAGLKPAEPIVPCYCCHCISSR